MDVKLWVDDFYAAPEGWHWAKTNTEAIRILSNPIINVQEMAIDHDIYHSMPEEGMTLVKAIVCAETFEATARFIKMRQSLGPYSKIYVTIQTGSPAGRKILVDILKDTPGIEYAIAYTKQPHDWTKYGQS